MKKVAIVGNYGLGLVKFRQELIEALVDEGHKVYILYPQDEYSHLIEDMGVTVLDLPMSRHGTGMLSEFKILKRLFSYVKYYQFDTVFSFTIKPNIYTGIVAYFFDFTFVPNITGLGSLYHSSRLGKFFYILLHKFSLRKANHVFFQNRSNSKIFIENKIMKDHTEFSVLPGSGVNLSKFGFLPYPSNDNFHFLFIGRLTRDKGIFELLEAFKNIQKTHDNVVLTIIGIVDDEKIEQKILANSSINYMGLQEDVRPYIEKSNCLVLPSYHEGMSNVLLEAASSGRPLLATNIPGCKEIIEHGANGFLVEPQSVHSLESGMKKILDLSQEQLKIMGEKSRDIVASDFDRNIIVKAYLEKGMLNE